MCMYVCIYRMITVAVSLHVYRVPIYKAESLDTQLDEVWNIRIKESVERF